MKAFHMVVDQEAKSTTGRATIFKDLLPTDLFPSTSLHFPKVPQSPRITPLAEEEVYEMLPGM